MAPPAHTATFLVDGANLITALGLVLAIGAVVRATCTTDHRFALALAVAAIVCDHLDGFVARATKGRSEQLFKFGSHLDSYTDFITKAIFPAVLLVAQSGCASWATAVAAVYVLCIALQYSFLDANGCYVHPKTRKKAFYGLSPDYNILFFSALYLFAPAALPDGSAHYALAALMLALGLGFNANCSFKDYMASWGGAEKVTFIAVQTGVGVALVLTA